MYYKGLHFPMKTQGWTLFVERELVCHPSGSDARYRLTHITKE